MVHRNYCRYFGLIDLHPVWIFDSGLKETRRHKKPGGNARLIARLST
nr:MAG TPA: hypothetical protein [Caudoviricetes sp.]